LLASILAHDSVPAVVSKPFLQARTLAEARKGGAMRVFLIQPAGNFTSGLAEGIPSGRDKDVRPERVVGLR